MKGFWADKYMGPGSSVAVFSSCFSEETIKQIKINRTDDTYGEESIL